MSQKSNESSPLTVLVFRDDLASRSFQFSLRWLTQAGTILLIGLVLFILSLFFAVKYYRQARSADPTRVMELERQLEDLNSQIHQAKTDTEVDPADSHSESSAPFVPTGQETPSTLGVAQLYPPHIKPLEPNAARPLAISEWTLRWVGKTLQVRFAIQYVGPAGGNQQGHIVILARGPKGISVYPEKVLNSESTSPLFIPQRGEFFSVSRFRETTAQFRVAESPSEIQVVEALLFSKDGTLLVDEQKKLEMPHAAPQGN